MQRVLFFASIKARNFNLAFEFLRYYHVKITNSSDMEDDRKTRLVQIHLAMDYVFCHVQTVGYQRFIQRCLARMPDSAHLHVMAGNNSLTSGTYKAAICKYFSIKSLHKYSFLDQYTIALKERPYDPLICLHLAICFANLSK